MRSLHLFKVRKRRSSINRRLPSRELPALPEQVKTISVNGWFAQILKRINLLICRALIVPEEAGKTEMDLSIYNENVSLAAPGCLPP